MLVPATEKDCMGHGQAQLQAPMLLIVPVPMTIEPLLLPPAGGAAACGELAAGGVNIAGMAVDGEAPGELKTTVTASLPSGVG